MDVESADGKTKNKIDFILSNDQKIFKDVSVLNIYKLMLTRREVN